MRTSSMCYSNFQVHKFFLKSPCVRLASLGRTWARNFKVLSSSSSCTAESSANCFRSIKFSDAPTKMIWDGKSEPPLNMLAFDLETSRLSYRTGKIVEIGIRRVQGGKNSCFQTLVNPEQDNSNSYIRRLRADMVRHTDVPTMKQVIPILLRFIQSSQELEGQVMLLAAHNARTFDVRFLIEAFRRCSLDIPHDWLFLDTLPLAREVMKLYAKRLRGPDSPESQTVQTLPENLRLQTLGEFYEIPKEGEPHRAMTDANLLTSILEKMISDLEFGPADLLQRAFKASDVNNSKKKS